VLVDAGVGGRDAPLRGRERALAGGRDLVERVAVYPRSIHATRCAGGSSPRTRSRRPSSTRTSGPQPSAARTRARRPRARDPCPARGACGAVAGAGVPGAP
jgi:hypothetical protein